MRRLALIAALSWLGACGGGQPTNKQEPPAPPPPPSPPPAPVPEVNKVEARPAGDDPGLAAMSPSRRRAYDRGLADCRAGRYDPDPWPEAYRIGCAAAHDR